MSNRIIYPAGGAFGTWNSITLESPEDWMVVDEPKTFKPASNTRGALTENIQDFFGKVSIKPKVFSSGMVAFLQKMLPYRDIGGAVGKGKSIFPASDLSFVIQQLDGNAITYPAAAVTKMPDLLFHSSKPLINSAVEFTLLAAANLKLTDANAYAVVAANAYTEPGFDPATEVYDLYTPGIGLNGTATSGATTSGSSTITVASTAGIAVGQGITGTGIPASTTVATVTDSTHLVLSANASATNTGLTLTLAPVTFVPDDSGILFKPTVTLEAVKPCNSTTYNWRVKDLSATIEFTPLDLDVDTFYARYFPPTRVGLGQAMTGGSAGLPFQIVGSGSGKLSFGFGNVAPVKPGGPGFDEKSRQKKITLGVYPAYSGGTFGTLFSIGTVA
jgi:hypothetical protein